MILALIRTHYNKEYTGGVLCDENIIICNTLELPNKNNAPQVSCIPEGDYISKRFVSEKFGETFLLSDVPNRSGILIHKGNTPEDTHGCILLGEKLSILNDEIFLSSSKAGFERFIKRLVGIDEFLLKITS